MKYRRRYWNAGGFGIAIVEVVSPSGVDWAAYIGADNGESEEDCVQSVASSGAKLSRQDALHFFPSMASPSVDLPYRE